jgi:DNA-binding NarL/FixJ family response regulator
MKRIADLLLENHAIVREEFRKMLEMGGDTEVIRCAKPI